MPADLKEAVVIEGGVSRYGALLIVCDEQRGKPEEIREREKAGEKKQASKRRIAGREEKATRGVRIR